jgi:hypothetical protein
MLLVLFLAFAALESKGEKSITALQTQTDLDSAKAEAFASRVLTTLNDGALCLMISVGHRMDSSIPCAPFLQQPQKRSLRKRVSMNGTCVNGSVRW